MGVPLINLIWFYLNYNLRTYHLNWGIANLVRQV